jgi:diguanylate cyclase (GGDEF)-like protein
MYGVQTPQLQRMLDELQAAIREHAEWHRRLIRMLVCRLEPTAADLREDSHRQCNFGRWLYGSAWDDLRERPEYPSIEAEHNRLHELAAAVLRDMLEDGEVSQERFDAFVGGSGRLRKQLDSLRHEVAAALRSRDALTGVYGRVEILPQLREARALAQRELQPSCIAFMDLDHFKTVNDVHGHRMGDDVLASAAHRISGHLRRYDRVFRYGGDEFLLLLPGTHLGEALQLVERIREGLSDAVLATASGGEQLRLTASFGLTTLEPDLPVEECISRADSALLAAKAAGRNRTVCWTPPAARAGEQGAPQ